MVLTRHPLWLIFPVAFLCAGIFSACNEDPVGDIDHSTPSPTAGSYVPLKKGNWWLYALNGGPYMMKSRIGDSLRHQDGHLLYAYDESYFGPGMTTYTLSYYYAIDDSGLSLYYSPFDSVYHNGQWFTTSYPKRPLLREPIVAGHSWTYTFSGEVEHFVISSVGSQTVAGQNRTAVVAVIHSTAAGRDTSWYVKELGLLSVHDSDGGRREIDSLYVQ